MQKHLPETPGPSDRLCSAQGEASWVCSHTQEEESQMQTRLVGRSGTIKSTWKLTLRELSGLVLKWLKTQLLGFKYVEPWTHFFWKRSAHDRWTAHVLGYASGSKGFWILTRLHQKLLQSQQMQTNMVLMNNLRLQMSCIPALEAHKPLQLQHSKHLQQIPALKTAITWIKDFKIHFSNKICTFSDSH